MINYFTKTIVSNKNCYYSQVLNCKWFQKNLTNCDLEKLNFSIFGADINSFGRRYEKKRSYIFERCFKLYFSVDAQTEIQILK